MTKFPVCPTGSTLSLTAKLVARASLKVPNFGHIYKASHVAPEPVEWPKTGVLLQQSGPLCNSRIGFKNCYKESTGIAIFVKVCAFEDRNEERPKALAKFFCHPGCQTDGADLPFGLYHIRVASGHDWQGDPDKKAGWYGEKYMFGPAGSYMKDSAMTKLEPGTNLTISYPAGDDETLVRIDPKIL